MLIIGHRGAKGEIKQHTLESIERAIDSGVDMVEFDVMTTKDNIPVLYHGLRFSAWGRKQLPEVMSYRLLKSLRPNIARLDEALEHCANKVGVDIDVKTRKVDAIIKTLQKYYKSPDDIDKFFLSSHMFCTLKRIQSRWPEARIAAYSLNPFSWIVRNQRLNLFAVGFPRKQRLLIQPLAMRLGLKTYIYSVNDRASAEKYEKCGTWAIITNEPSALIGKPKPRKR